MLAGSSIMYVRLSPPMTVQDKMTGGMTYPPPQEWIFRGHLPLQHELDTLELPDIAAPRFDAGRFVEIVLCDVSTSDYFYTDRAAIQRIVNTWSYSCHLLQIASKSEIRAACRHKKITLHLWNQMEIYKERAKKNKKIEQQVQYCLSYSL